MFKILTINLVLFR